MMNRLLLSLFLLLLPISAFAGMPTIEERGTCVVDGDGSGDITPSYPVTGLAANDIFFLQVITSRFSTDNTATINTPTNFTLLHADTATSAGVVHLRQSIFYKVATGSETGTETVSVNNDVSQLTKMACMYRTRGSVTSSFAEDSDVTAVASSDVTITHPPVTTLGVNRLVLAFVAINDDQAQASFTSETGGDLTEFTTPHTSSVGDDGGISLQTATMAAAGTITGGSFTIAATRRFIVRAFGLVGSSARRRVAARILP